MDTKKDTKKNAKKTPKYYCEQCNFNCSKLSDWNRHITTAKHIGVKRVTQIIEEKRQSIHPLDDDGKCVQITYHTAEIELENKWKCECGKIYKHRQGLYKHKNKCKFIKQEEEEEEKEDEKEKEEEKQDNPNDPTYKDLLIKAMKDMTDMRKEMVSMMPLIGNNNNNTTTTNNTFNLQFFLNNDCKDALNLTDFIDSLRLQLNDLEYTTDNGHVKGITNIFQTALSNMEETKRPMHCTDLKRETLYIKDNDEWQVDEDKERIKEAVETVTNKNISNTSKWLEKYPGHTDPNSKDFEKYVKMTHNSMGTGEELEQNKIVKNIMKEVKLETKKS
jgi:hypothetical protein